ncbi:hypothetical protein BH11MYX4_BH11MYX4_21470 [soil metagenome]
MPLRTKLAVAFGSSFLVGLVACGGADPSISDFNKGQSSGNGGFDDGRNTGGDNGLGDTGKTTDPDLKACATQTAAAEAKPVYLVFMFDKSGSMVQNGSPKWSSSKAATKAFFESNDSKGISASLSFFPDKENYSCNTSAYGTPKVAMAALPSTQFAGQLDAQSPAGGTPTYQAMQGAIGYAQGIAAGQGKDGSVAIVLVTDGLPQADCNNTSVNEVANLAASVSATIPTYVIGVGDALSNLNDIAVGGATKAALVVSQSNPAQVQADFTKAINQIKASALTCDYKIPAAPAGSTFDRAKVNVQHTPAGAAAATLQYNQSCAGGTGWKYDDANNPTRILLCDGSCSGVKATSGKVDILFGCATQSGPVK